jgi:HlyD family secretion protein
MVFPAKPAPDPVAIAPRRPNCVVNFSDRNEFSAEFVIMRSWWSWGILLIAAAAIGGLAYASLNGGTPVDAAKVERKTVQEYVDEEAKTRLAETYRITMPFAARIEAIPLVEGTPVKKDEIVAQVVPKDLELQVQVATAAVERLKASIRENDDVTVESTSLEQAMNFVQSMDRTVEAATERVKSGLARLGYAETNLARVNKLAQTKAATQDELDRATVQHVESKVEYRQDVLVQRAMEAAQAATALMPTGIRQYIARKTLSRDVLEKQLAEAKIRLEEAERDRDRGILRSPVDGVVLERAVSNEGQQPAGTLLLRIGRWEDLEIEADVLSQEVVRVKLGDKVEVTGPAIGPTPAHAKVTRVYPAGFTKVSSLGVEQQRVKVVMKFDEKDLDWLRKDRDLGVDFRVRVRIITNEKNGALVFPRSALFRGAKGEWKVFAIRNGRATETVLQVGLANDEFVEVTKGLSEGEQVVLAPESNLADGSKVRVLAE